MERGERKREMRGGRERGEITGEDREEVENGEGRKRINKFMRSNTSVGRQVSS